MSVADATKVVIEEVNALCRDAGCHDDAGRDDSEHWSRGSQSLV
jgi:hypothetical protein